jgi:sulfate transport system ATP-binding protein
MDKGRIEQMGTPNDVYDNPASAFVHGFIGESIELPVDVANGEVRIGGTQVPLAAEGLANGPSILFIRRHDVQVSPVGSGALQGAVIRVRSFGPVQRAEVMIAHAQLPIEIDAPRDRELRPGDIVGLKPRRYRIFAA